jgi:hypothetical protein
LKLDPFPRFPADRAQMERKLTDLFRATNVQVNQLTEGTVSAVHSAATAAPTAGSYAVGDFVRNSAPSELGTVGSKYVVMGFLCTVGGTPGTFVQCRALTGN